MKKIILSAFVLLSISIVLLLSCAKKDDDPMPDNGGDVPTELVFAQKDTSSDFKIVYADGGEAAATYIKETLTGLLNADISIVDESTDPSSKEIIVNSTSRAESAELMKTLAEGEFAIKADTQKIIVAANGDDALNAAATYFANMFVDSKNTKAVINVNTEIKQSADRLYLAKKGEKSPFVIKYGKRGEDAAKMLQKKLSEEFGVELELKLCRGTNVPSYPFEINLASDSKFEDGIEIYDAGVNQYSISTSCELGKTALNVYASDSEGEMMAVLRLISEYTDSEKGEFVIPTDISVNKNADAYEYGLYEEYIRGGDDGEITDKELLVGMVIRRTGASETIRDPNLIYENGTYYMYYSGGGVWYCSTSTSLYGPWGNARVIAKLSDLSEVYGINARKYDYNWAPEVHKYKDSYYLFSTYWCCEEDHNSPYEATWSPYIGHRAVVVLRSDNPTGPFVPISKDADGVLGHSTPGCQDTIDATLYVDPDGQPWMVYSHEWTSSPNSVGSMYAAKLTDDLSSFIGEPVQIFTANAKVGSKTTTGVPDGPFLYRTKDGQLICLWSSFVDGGYVVIQAVSESGDILGPWTQSKNLLYDSTMYKDLPGGHPSLVTDADGQMYLVLHSPNGTSDDRPGVHESPTFIPVIEKNNRLVWGLNAKTKTE